MLSIEDLIELQTILLRLKSIARILNQRDVSSFETPGIDAFSKYLGFSIIYLETALDGLPIPVRDALKSKQPNPDDYDLDYSTNPFREV